MAAGLEFRILGPLEVRRGGKLIPITGSRQRLLLGLLLVRANEAVTSEELVDELWNGRAPHAAKASLHNQVARLRKLLGSDALETHSSAYRLQVAPGQLDLSRFERLLSGSRSHEPEIRAVKLREALAEWRGPPLADLPPNGTLQIEILRLEELRLVALEDRIESELALGLNAELVPELESLVEAHPLRERLWAHLMVALYRSERQAEALATYRRAHAAFAELGIQPGPALKRLQRAILVQDRKLVHGGGNARDELLERIAPLLPTPDERSRARAVYEYGSALWLLGERERSEAALKKAAQIAAEAGDQSLEELALLEHSWHALFTEGGSLVAYLAHAQQARRVFEENDDHASLARSPSARGIRVARPRSCRRWSGGLRAGGRAGEGSRQRRARERVPRPGVPCCVSRSDGGRAGDRALRSRGGDRETARPLADLRVVGARTTPRSARRCGPRARTIRIRRGRVPRRGAVEPAGAHSLLSIMGIRVGRGLGERGSRAAELLRAV